MDAQWFVVVGEAENGAAAIAQTRSLRPDVVLLDIQLPDTDGFAVARQLSEAPDPPQVVLVSTRDASSYRHRLESASARLHREGPTLGSRPLPPSSTDPARANLARLAFVPAGVALGVVAEWPAPAISANAPHQPGSGRGQRGLRRRGRADRGGAVCRRRRSESRIGTLLIAAGFAWFLGTFASSLST